MEFSLAGEAWRCPRRFPSPPMPKKPRDGDTFSRTLARARSSSVGRADLSCPGLGLPPLAPPPLLLLKSVENPRVIGDCRCSVRECEAAELELPA